jgi:hypothetical protein
VNVTDSEIKISRIGDCGLSVFVFVLWFLECDPVQDFEGGRSELLSFSSAFSAGLLDQEQPMNSWHSYNFRAVSILQAATRFCRRRATVTQSPVLRPSALRVTFLLGAANATSRC